MPIWNSLVEMGEDVNIEMMTRMKNDKGKEAECPDDTAPVDMEGGLNDRNDDNIKHYEETCRIPIWNFPCWYGEGVNDRNVKNMKKW